MAIQKLIKKLISWEHWSSAFFYIPNIPYAIYLALKTRNLTFFSIVNPAFYNSGNGLESKFKTIQLVPEKYRPKSILVYPKANIKTVLEELEAKKIIFPVIAKPDIGFRGLLVEKINTADCLNKYLKNYPIKIIIQEFLDYKYECGIFYHRKPNLKKGHISSFTIKRFPVVLGNGKSTLKELINTDERAKLYNSIFEKIHKDNINIVPKKDEEVRLTFIGNHSKGTQFVNGNNLITDKLKKTFDNLSLSINGWYYGRVDIKYNTMEELESGKNFKIIEINGIIAEPTHIYDCDKNSFFKALKTIRKHWKYLYQIAYINHNELKIPFKSSVDFIKDMIKLRKYIKKINSLKN